MAGYAFDRLLTSNTPLGVPVTGQPRVRDWIDGARPAGIGRRCSRTRSRATGDRARSRGGTPSSGTTASQRAFVGPDGTFTYTPFPSTSSCVSTSRPARSSGTDDAPPYVLAAPNDSRFGLAGSQTAANVGLVLRAVDRPYRALWASRGLDSDGWTTPGRPATIRVYAARRGDRAARSR